MTHVWHHVGLSDNSSTADITPDGELRVAVTSPVTSPQGAVTVIPASIEAHTSLDAATATGTGTALDAGQIVPSATMYVAVTGEPDAFDVEVQASLDGTEWFSTGAAITVAGTTALASTHARYYRANLTILTGGTSPTVTVHLAASY